MKIYTIGFTKKSAKEFFEALKQVGIKKLLDVRLNNKSQLAGFTKKDDLKYFLEQIAGIEYSHEPLLAPTQDMLDAYKKLKGSWVVYEAKFMRLMNDRHVAEKLPKTIFETPTVLLCSEPTAKQCHRRLILEYLEKEWGNINIVHL